MSGQFMLLTLPHGLLRERRTSPRGVEELLQFTFEQ